MGKSLWQWQKEGTSWRGIGIYHVTLTVPSRQLLLGRLVVTDSDPSKARVERTELGRLLLECQRSVPVFHPEIQILQYCLMPDHLHMVWYVRRPMEKSIRQVAQGFWQAVKKLGRAYSYIVEGESDACLTGGTMNERDGAVDACLTDGTMNERGGALRLSSIVEADSQKNSLCLAIGKERYCRLDPVFIERPFLRPLSRRGQLHAMIRYVQMNPQRLATKRMMPGFFCMQQGIELGERIYSGVGNVKLLSMEHFAAVHVRGMWVRAAERGDRQQLRSYMNGCVIEARKGCVMVSPFISPQEKQVMRVLLDEKHPFILLADNGFRNYYKPSAALFEACAEGRVLILSPWTYDADKRHVTREECVALNEMAEAIVLHLNG
ncbi:hypothetical protein [Xylanibacter brevis]|uniref:hypothetical protein n=1 Tax=Xylanibacter brevis TaxID=83231 RepID=UPI0004844CA7|nr:hypothetical protein [Xylanibacter brevis]